MWIRQKSGDDMTHDISRYDDDDDDDDDDDNDGDDDDDDKDYDDDDDDDEHDDEHDEDIVGSRVLNISTIKIKKLKFQRGLVTSACKSYL